MEVVYPTRHPELVSGSILPHARSHRRQTKANRQIMPVGVLTLDQIDLPLPVPAFQLFLTRYGRSHVAEHLVSDEPADAVTARVARDGVIPMLPQPGNQIAGDADVERSIGLAGEDIDARVTLELHEPEPAEKWMLRQVQHDEFEAISSPSRHPELVSGSISPEGVEQEALA